MKLIGTLIALSIALLVFITVDSFWIKPGDLFEVPVVAKAYSPASTTTSTGYTIGPKGEMMPSTSTSYKAEQWIVAFGGGVSVDAGSALYAQLEPGVKCKLREYKGGISGWVHYYRIEEVLPQ